MSKEKCLECEVVIMVGNEETPRLCSECHQVYQNWEKEDESGFSFQGMFITDPTMNENGTDTVDPDEHYGQVYRSWKLRREQKK